MVGYLISGVRERERGGGGGRAYSADEKELLGGEPLECLLLSIGVANGNVYVGRLLKLFVLY